MKGEARPSQTALWLAALGTCLLAACASAPPSPAVTTPPAAAPPSAASAPVAELPPGPGRDILQTQCTTCHDLREVTKFRGFYTRQQWRDIVGTMVEYGATVKDSDVDVLTGYLDANLGRK